MSADNDVKSLQQLAAGSLHRTIGLGTVLPMLDWCKQHPALLGDTEDQCRRYRRTLQQPDVLIMHVTFRSCNCWNGCDQQSRRCSWHMSMHRFVIQTFDALVDVEGADAISQALNDPDL